MIRYFLLFAATAACAQEIAFDSAANFLKLPEHTYLGEAAGVATNSKGHVYVFTRTGGEQATAGASRIFTHGGSRLFEFDAAGKYGAELGVGIYGFMFAQSVKVDAQDNIWTVDRGANVIIKFDPSGKVLMNLGRKPESVSLEPRGPGRAGNGAGIPGDNFNRPTDIAFDSSGNIFVADGYSNARVAKFDRNGKFLKSWGMKGTGQGQFDMPNSIAVDAQNNVYVADLNNKRIQVFDNNGAFKSQITSAGAPWALCISPGSHQYLYVSNSNPPDSMDNAEIYKMELDGKVLGRLGRAGKLSKEFGTVNQMDCRLPNTLIVGELTNWRVQKLTLH